MADREFKSRYFGRDGQPITLEEWSKLTEDRKYKVVKQTTVGVHWVSTVWLGLDHGWGRSPRMIFETLVFEQGPRRVEDRELYQGMRKLQNDDYSPWSEVDGERYSTEAEALDGHARLVEKWSRPQ